MAARGRRRAPTGRALALGAVLVLLAVVLASPVQRYLAARAAVADARGRLARTRTDLAELQQQKALWSDPAYVEQQARARLQYAMPGDTVYLVVRPGQKSALAGEPRATIRTKLVGTTWNQRVWGSVLAADAAP